MSRTDIRVVDVPKSTHKKVKALAKREKRTISKQALILIESGLKNTNA